MHPTQRSAFLPWRESWTPYGEKRLKPAQNRGEPGYTGHVFDDPVGLATAVAFCGWI